MAYGLRDFVNDMSSTLRNPGQWLVDWIRNDTTDAGVPVNYRSALGYPPVWYAVNRISGHVARLPLNLRRKLDRGSEIADRHPVYRLMKTKPNRYQTAFKFRQTIQAHALLTGNGRAAIIRDSANIPRELVPLYPQATCTVVTEGQKWHVYNTEIGRQYDCWSSYSNSQDLVNQLDFFGADRDNYIRFRDQDVIHIMGLSWDGVCGLSLVDVAREAMGCGIAGQRAVAMDFANGSRPSVVIQVPQGVMRDEQQAKEFLAHWNEYHSGVTNNAKAALLRDGMTLATMQVSASDAQWLEERNFSRQDVALLFGLEHITGDDTSVSYNSLEQKFMAYKVNCLDPWLECWEQECNDKLLGDESKSTHYWKFNVNALLRPDANSRSTFYEKMVMMRAMSPNEVRELEDLNPYPEGDVYANPAITPGPEDMDSSEAEMAKMIEIVAKRANEAAEKAHRKGLPYGKWIIREFGQDGKLANAVIDRATELGFDPAQAREMLNEMARNLMTVREADNLPAVVPAAVSAWPFYATKLREGEFINDSAGLVHTAE